MERDGRGGRELHEAFERELAEVVGLARYKARRARVEDVEAVVAEWRARCWRVYPRLVREAAEDGASGRRGRHTVAGYLCRVMGNLLADVRRREVARGRVAVRADGEEWRRTVRPDSERVRLDGLDEGAEWLGMDGVVDEGAADPAEVAEKREALEVLRRGLAGLDAGEREAVVGWMEERSDAALAAGAGVAAATVWRRRRRGVERLRELFREAGWEIRREAERRLRRSGRRERRVRFRGGEQKDRSDRSDRSDRGGEND